MKRSLCGLAVLGLAAVPDWAAAFDPCWVPPPPCGYGYWYAVPVYLVPVHPALPPAVAVAPVRQAPLAPPRITPVEQPATATPKPAPPRIEPAPIPPAFAAPTAAPPPDSVRPAGGAAPSNAPAVGPPVTPAALDTLPPAGLPVAPPTPAPAADPKKPEALPPLVLPPDIPGGPSGVVPGSTSRSSPVGGPSVEVVRVAGAAAAAATRKVGFFNHTGQPIELVIAGRAVTLPRKSYLHAEVPPAFRWRYNGNPAEAATVPDDAAGLDIVFRD